MGQDTSKKLIRREFLKGAASVAVGGGLLAACTKTGDAPHVQTQPNLRWELVSSFPRSLDTIFGAADVLANRLKELTNGRFTIRVRAGGEIVPPLQVLDAVQQAAAEIGHSASYYYIGKKAALAFDTAIPFGLNARQQAAWTAKAGGLELMRDVFADFDIVQLPGGNTGVQMGGWFRDPVRSLDDLKGLRMRIPGLGGEVMSRLGVTVQQLAAQEIYLALERGAIDATEWVGPYDDQKLGFHKITKNYHYPGWWEPGPALTFYVNRKAWDQLPSTYRAALETAAAEASAGMSMAYDALNPKALRSLVEQGVQLIPFPEEVMSAARKVMEEMVHESVAADPEYAKIYRHWSQFKKDSDRWFSKAEHAYNTFTYQNL